MLDAARQARFVRVRHGVRRLIRLGPLALVVWFTALIVGLETTDDYSARHEWITDNGNLGFVLILFVLALAAVFAVITAFTGATARVAARTVPIVRSLPEPVVRPDGYGDTAVELSKGGERRVAFVRERNGRRLPLSRRDRVLAVVLVAAVIVTAMVSGFSAANIGPQYRASHGVGGPILTIGENSRVTRVERNYSGRRSADTTTYYIANGDVEVTVEGQRRPERGEQYTVIDIDGGPTAVRIGGHRWITSTVLTIVFGLAALAVLIVLAVARARRPRDTNAITLPDLRTRLVREGPLALALRRSGSVSGSADVVATFAAK